MRDMVKVLVLLICLQSAWCLEQESEIKFKSVKTFYEFGNIVKGVELALDTLDNMWAQRFGGTFDFEANRGAVDIYVGAGGIFWHAIPEVATQTSTQVFFGDAILSKAYAQYHLGDTDEPRLKVKLGYFPVKYSPSKNLGEYMFRTGTYPSYIVTGNALTTVNTAAVGVLGTQINHRINDIFTHALFFTSERQSFPLHDFSVTYMVEHHGSFLHAGLGLQLNRLIPVSPSRTTPKDEKNSYFDYDGMTYANNPEYYKALSDAATADGETDASAAWLAIRDTVNSLNSMWDDGTLVRPDMNYYTFKGIKPEASLSLDFKGLLDEGMFRNDEMVLYSEAVLMGWDNKPIYYEDRMERLAVMVGFNFPSFGLLDVLNVEVEQYSSPYVNGYRTAREGKIPLPDYLYNFIDGYDPKDWNTDDLKWSVFISREITKGISLQAQVASDHLRGRRGSRVVSEQSLLVDSDHWYYFFKLQAAL